MAKKLRIKLAFILLFMIIVFIPVIVEATPPQFNKITAAENHKQYQDDIGFQMTGKKNRVLELPESLKTIDESSFAGTAVQMVKVPGKVEVIGQNAFAYTNELKAVNIPTSVSFIGKNAFSDNVLIFGLNNSYGQQWAMDQGRPFRTANIPVTVFFEKYLISLNGNMHGLRNPFLVSGNIRIKIKPSCKTNCEPIIPYSTEYMSFDNQRRAPPIYFKNRMV